jgi:transcriptional regulator with XRE-family HTH domain
MFSENLKALRMANELTQDQVATYLGVMRSAYANYESGTRNMPLAQMHKAADLFGCSLSTLLSEDPDEVKNILPFAFRADDLTASDLNELAKFKKVALNYIKMSNLLRNG